MRYHLYDPGECGDTCFATYCSLENAMKAGNDLIAIYRDQCDPEWPEYVEGIAIYEGSDAEGISERGKLVAYAAECSRIERPDDVDEDGYSPSEDLWFNCVDFYVDYKMRAA
ncbi:hypothetical protein [Rhizobium phage RHph_X2_25]|nr:hypothetical protein [Rhizobium phage RHph_X2_25]